MRRRTIILATVVAVLVAVPAGWYFASPWWTLWRIREAARDGDVQRLASYVDFAAVTRSAEAQVHDDWRSTLAGLHSDTPGVRTFRALAERIVARPHPATFTSPGNVRAWLSNIALPVVGGTGREAYHPAVEHHGLDEFVVVDATTRRGGSLTFRRHGLGWKLEAVRWGIQ